MSNPMGRRENYLRTLEFRTPEWIPCSVNFAPLTWRHHGTDLERIVLSHPHLFPDYIEGSGIDRPLPPTFRAGELFRDNWGCVWDANIDGIEGQVVESPLSDWDSFKEYSPPDFRTLSERGERDWKEIALAVRRQKAEGRLTTGDGERLFDRLYFLRGFENLLVDIATDDPRLEGLVGMLEEYELQLVRAWLDLGVDVMAFHTDIGAQDRLMISPSQFRRHIKPMFKRIFQTCRKAGAHVSLSSDGRLVEIVDDLVECGVSVHDPQFRANTLEGIERHYKGKLCIKLDLDRQMFAFCSPGDIRAQVDESVDRLALPEGGLMMWGSVWDDKTPIANIAALCESLEDLCLGA